MTTNKASINAPRPEDVGAFWSRITNRGGGPAKTSRFLIQIASRPRFPDSWKLNFPQEMNRLSDLTFQCDTAEIPGRSIATNDIQIGGPTIKLPYGSTYSDMTLNFICTNDMYERKIFDDWLNYINNVTNFTISFREDYTTSIYIFQYDEGGDQSMSPAVTFGVELIEAYPIAINPMQLAWAEDSVHRLGVTFAYTYYRPLSSLTAPRGIPSSVLAGLGSASGVLSTFQNALVGEATGIINRSLNGALTGFSSFLGSFFS
jgi:hypothetical protein